MKRKNTAGPFLIHQHAMPCLNFQMGQNGGLPKKWGTIQWREGKLFWLYILQKEFRLTLCKNKSSLISQRRYSKLKIMFHESKAVKSKMMIIKDNDLHAAFCSILCSSNLFCIVCCVSCVSCAELHWWHCIDLKLLKWQPSHVLSENGSCRCFHKHVLALGLLKKNSCRRK